MRFTPRTWSLLSLMLFVAAVFVWLKGNDLEARRRQLKQKTEEQTNQSARLELSTPHSTHLALAQLTQAGVKTSPAQVGSPTVDAANPLRLRNTSRDVDDLVREDKAILLANALFDTANGSARELEIPEHLKAKGDPGSYIVQADHAPDAKFRQQLAEAGAQIISYVPNNAYLVKIDQDSADSLASTAGIQSVLPYEPYYKIAAGLLRNAVDQQPLADGTLLRLTLIPGDRAMALADLKRLNALVLSEESSPFGPQVVIQPESTSLPDIAQLPSVQGIEPDLVRMPANDLSRVTLGIATNGSASNYLNLTGSNIWVNFNDVGVDTNYPGLEGRVFVGYRPMGGTDVDGHGTFVAGMIAGDGSNSPDMSTNSIGSETNANFRGIAPLAKLLGLPLDSGEDVYPKVQDSYLIETAARSNYLTFSRTNVLISNNSWTYPLQDYDSAAARYDAAVRDAIPGETASQPLLFVFAAGNSGGGNDSGGGGRANSIESPGTAKNVITVGALEQPRFITNFYILTNVFTNTLGNVETNTATNFPFAAMTDSANEVASFSSRGNVGAGFEGNFGRFKPDVVAPGTMIVSARSEGWNITNVIDTNTPLGQLYVTLHTNLNEYRFDSGTTFSAANVSGMLALVQEYYETLAPTTMKGSLSPALMKGLLINGSRPVNAQYDIAARSTLNHQGWGLPSLPAVFPSFSTNAHKDLDEKHWRLRFVEQSPTNALATSQSRTWNVTLSTNASGFPFRITLVWTDPPGNPNVGLKLVNDLDLVITNLDTGIVWYGNNFPSGTDFSEPSFPEEGDPVISDQVNNVENVFIARPFLFGRKFSITVAARRVNVNSVNDFLVETKNTNDVTQDFALVVSSEMGEDGSLNSEDIDYREEEVFEEFTAPEVTLNGPRLGITIITNGLPLLTERVGANASLVGTNGVTNQWNFYVFTNIYIPNNLVNITNGSNVAFVTFDPPNLAKPRNIEADIDLYVSKDSRLTNLEPSVVASAFKSVERGGTELVVFTNAAVGADSIYYVAVKSEDQQAAEFSLVGISSDLPFDQDQNGQRLITAMPFSSYIPDGSASKPAASTLIGIGLTDRRVQRIIATNTISHENLGDLVGILRHSGTSVVLNNHTLNNGNYIGTNTIIYNDYDPTGDERPTDGPGSLNDFAGTKITGPWFLQMIDNAPSHTGRVELLTLLIKPLEKPMISGVAVTATIDPNEMLFYPIDVPPGVTNLTFRFTDMTAGGILEAYLRRDDLPTTNIYELKTIITAPGGVWTFPTTNNAPLTPGTYFLALRNPGAVPVTFTMMVVFQYTIDPDNELHFVGPGPELFDDATTNQIVQVEADKFVGSAEVAVRMEHPRVADTVLTLVSPQGSRIILSENRGQTNLLGFGAEFSTNMAYTIFTDDTNYAEIPIKFAAPPFTDTNRVLQPVWTNGFEGANAGIYSQGQIVDGWTVSSNLVRVFSDSSAAFEGSKFLLLSGNFLSSSLPGQVTITNSLEKGQAYELRFVAANATDFRSTNAVTVFGSVQIDGIVKGFRGGSNWTYNAIQFLAKSNTTVITISSGDTPLFIDDVKVVETGNRFYLPEEPLALLQGERAIGQWKLELLDNKTGAEVPLPDLMSWKLDLIYADPVVLAEPLQNNRTYPKTLILNQTNWITPGTLFTNQVQYFIVNTCPDTTEATVTLIGSNNVGQVEMFIDRSGIPTGNPDTDDYVALLNTDTPNNTLNGSATFRITSSSPASAPLQPGKPFFIAVRNRAVNTTNSYMINIRLDRSSCVTRQSTRLLKRQTVLSMLSANTSAQENEGELYSLEVPEGSQSVSVNVAGDGDVAIVAQKDIMPTRQSYSLAQDIPGSGNEQLTISGNSTVPLTAGTWYFLVLNQSPRPVVYNVFASGDLPDTNGQTILDIVRLNDRVQISWFAETGHTYTIQRSSNLTQWTDLDTVAGTGGTLTYAPIPGLNQMQFFRIVKN